MKKPFKAQGFIAGFVWVAVMAYVTWTIVAVLFELPRDAGVILQILIVLFFAGTLSIKGAIAVSRWVNGRTPG